MIQWNDVTDWETYWAPEDGDKITSLVLSQLEKAYTAKATVYSSQYGFTDAEIATAFGEIGKQDINSRFLFDKSQYFGRYEKPLVKNLIASLQPVQWGIGTSSVSDEILHSKIVAILYPDNTGWTFSGSFNLSSSASKEFNVADFITSRSRAENFATEIQAKLTWVQTHQPQPPHSPIKKLRTFIAGREYT